LDSIIVDGFVLSFEILLLRRKVAGSIPDVIGFFN
jgi:hypothetical protein